MTQKCKFHLKPRSLIWTEVLAILSLVVGKFGHTGFYPNDWRLMFSMILERQSLPHLTEIFFL